MVRNEVYALCIDPAKKLSLDPIILTALCEQESSYDSRAMRMEPGFYRRYVKPLDYSPPTGLMFATSFGLTQVMGLNLHTMGLFRAAYKAYWVRGATPPQNSPTLPAVVASALENYLYEPQMQIEYGARWLAPLIEKHGVEKGLLRYNGGVDPLYAHRVLNRADNIRKELGL